MAGAPKGPPPACACAPCVQRLQGKRVTFITGTDEHGEKIAAAAAARGMEPRQHCDDIVASYKQLWQEVRCKLVLGAGLAQRGWAKAGVQRLRWCYGLG